MLFGTKAHLLLNTAAVSNAAEGKRESSALRKFLSSRTLLTATAFILLLLTTAGCGDAPGKTTTPQEASQQESITQQGANTPTAKDPGASGQDAVTNGGAPPVANPNPSGK